METTIHEEKIGYKDIFKQKEYLKLIVANLISRFGDSIDAIAFTWLVYAVTGSASWSAIIFAVNQLPTVILQPFAGALVEGMNKKRLMVITDMIRGMIVIGLALLYMNNLITPWILLAFTIINSSVEAFHLPAGMAIIPKIIDMKYYTYGTSLNSTLSRVVELIGLGAAGIVISAFGIGTSILIDGASFFGSALLIALLRIKENNLVKEKINISGYFHTLKEGVQYLGVQPVIRNLCILCVILNAIIVPINALQSPLIMDVMGQGSELMSVFAITLTCGMGLGSFITPAISKKIKARTSIALCILACGFSFFLYTLGQNFQSQIGMIYLLTVIASFLLGAVASICITIVNIQFMQVINQDYLARVGSIFNAGASAASPVVSFIISGATAFLSVVQIFQISALLCVIMFLFLTISKLQLSSND